MTFIRFLCEGEQAGQLEEQANNLENQKKYQNSKFLIEEEPKPPSDKWVHEVFRGFDTCTLDEGYTPLHIAIVMGNYELVSYLLLVLKWRGKVMRNKRIV